MYIYIYRLHAIFLGSMVNILTYNGGMHDNCCEGKKALLYNWCNSVETTYLTICSLLQSHFANTNLPHMSAKGSFVFL